MQHKTESGTPVPGVDWASPEAILEMRKTPRIRTWQEEEWLLCCKDFMTFLGAWEPNDFLQHAGDGSPESLFDRMCPEWTGSFEEFFGGPEQAVAFYAFQCRHCHKLRGNLDGA